MNVDKVTLRTATPDDQLFLKCIFFEIRSPEFERSGMTGEPLTAMLEQQFKAMRTYYDQVYSDAIYTILEYDGEPIGYFATIDDEALHLIDISIQGKYRNFGLGTIQMQALQQKAADAGKSMTLTVEKFNPALHLYERLGFVVYDEKGIYQRMRWQAN